MLVKCLGSLLVLQLLFVTAKAYQRCDTKFDSIDLICYDSYNTVGYCCDEYEGVYYDCCYYLQVWALWYFWFGIVLFLLLIAVVVGTCKKCMDKKKRQNTRNSHQMRNLNSVSGNVVVPQQSAPEVVFTDVPPTYYQVQAQGISDQYKDFSNYGEPIVPSIPPGVEPTPVPADPNNFLPYPTTTPTATAPQNPQVTPS